MSVFQRSTGPDAMSEERAPLCQFCGAYSPNACEVRDDYGCCPWEETEGDDENSAEQELTP